MEEKKELSTKEKRTLMIVSLAIVIALVFGISYAYFMAVGQSSEQTITTANLSLTFNDGTAIVNATDISPLVREVALPVQDSTGAVTTAGEAVTKTFIITNTGNQKLFVDISLDDMTLPDDLKRYDFLWSLYEVTDTTNNIEKNIGTGSFEYAEDGMKVGQYLVFDAPGDGVTTDTRTFRLYIWIEETYIEQEVMMGETFKATIKATGQKYYTSPESDFTVDENGVLTAYTGTDTDIVIPPTVNGVTVTSIGSDAFMDESGDFGLGITSAVIPDTVTEIGNFAFGYNRLTKLVIPSSVTTIGDYAFGGSSLTSVSIPNTVTYLGWGVFEDNNLKSVVIPNTLTKIYISTFAGNQLTNVIIPNSVNELENGIAHVGAFGYNPLTKVVIPSNVSKVGAYTFREISTLEEIIVIGKSSLDDFSDASGIKTDGYYTGLTQNINITFKP